MASGNGKSVFVTLFTNQIFVSAFTIVGMIALVWIFIGPAKDFFSDMVDKGRKNLLDAFGGPADSQQTNERTRTDSLVGLFDEEDRSLSDYISNPFKWHFDLVFGTEDETPSGFN